VTRSNSVPILVTLSNPRRSYCDFSIWPYDLEHVSRVAFRSGIIFIEVNSVSLSVPTLSLLIRYVTMWPWPLTPWPWTFAVHSV